jgi:hypothetical protein
MSASPPSPPTQIGITVRVSSSTRRVGVREARQTERPRRTRRYVPARRTCLDTSLAIASILDGTSMTPLQLSGRVFEDARSRTRLLRRGEFREALLLDGPDLVVYDDGTVITADWPVTETVPLVLPCSLGSIDTAEVDHLVAVAADTGLLTASTPSPAPPQVSQPPRTRSSSRRARASSPTSPTPSRSTDLSTIRSAPRSGSSSTPSRPLPIRQPRSGDPVLRANRHRDRHVR